jgi:hypothetical protein
MAWTFYDSTGAIKRVTATSASGDVTTEQLEFELEQKADFDHNHHAVTNAITVTTFFFSLMNS